MGVDLIKIVNGKPAPVSANLLNCELIKCGLCDKTYEFRYSDGEVSRLKEWLPKAEKLVNDSHANGHLADTLPVFW
jgi:hypothetical protein